MTAVTVLTVILLISATAACVAVIWLSREAVLSVRALRVLSDDVHARLMPLLEKADVTVDAANAELLRVDAAITRFEEASVRVGAASETISEFVHAPGDIVSGVADRVRRKWKERRRPDAEREAPVQGEETERTEAEADMCDGFPEE